MTTHRNSSDDSPRMVPDREDVATRGGRRRVSSGQSRTEVRTRGVVASSKSSGSVRFLLTILTLGMFSTAGAAYYFYTDSQVVKAEFEDAHARLLTLENRLSMVGNSAEETTLNLKDLIDENVSEIDKLWAARNKNVQTIAANKVAIDEQSNIITGLDGELEAEANRLNAVNAQLSTAVNQLDTMQSRINSITSNISNLDQFGQELQALGTDLNQVRSNLASMQGLSSRVGVAEQNIESINITRLQVNQAVTNMQNQINDLQNRLSQ